MKLIKKITLSGDLEILTGLHIGGTNASMNIGEVDLSVIKSPQDGKPIIPGSSLKGKLRSLLAKLEGSQNVDEDPQYIKEVFGGEDKDDKGKVTKAYTTRLIVRDSFLSNSDQILDWKKDGDYTEIKTENTIDRSSGTAKHPRQLERVPKGAKFKYDMILDVYDEDERDYLEDIKKAMRLLEDDYLGGNGSRGYGKISFHLKTMSITEKLVENYGNNASN